MPPPKEMVTTLLSLTRCFGTNTIISVLSWFSFNRLIFHPFTNIGATDMEPWWYVPQFFQWFDHDIDLSIICVYVILHIMWSTDFTNRFREHSFGPSTEPCGTPTASVCESDKKEPFATHWDLLLRYDLVYISTTVPNLLSKRYVRGAETECCDQWHQKQLSTAQHSTTVVV